MSGDVTWAVLLDGLIGAAVGGLVAALTAWFVVNRTTAHDRVLAEAERKEERQRSREASVREASEGLVAALYQLGHDFVRRESEVPTSLWGVYGATTKLKMTAPSVALGEFCTAIDEAVGRLPPISMDASKREEANIAIGRLIGFVVGAVTVYVHQGLDEEVLAGHVALMSSLLAGSTLDDDAAAE